MSKSPQPQISSEEAEQRANQRAERKAKIKQRNAILRPILGFIMIVVLGVIAYALGPTVTTILPASLRRSGNLTPDQLQWIITGLLFLVLVAIMALIFAIVLSAVAPPKAGKDSVKDSDLVKRKTDMKAEQLARKRREMAMRNEANRVNREKKG